MEEKVENGYSKYYKTIDAFGEILAKHALDGTAGNLLKAKMALFKAAEMIEKRVVAYNEDKGKSVKPHQPAPAPSPEPAPEHVLELGLKKQKKKKKK